MKTQNSLNRHSSIARRRGAVLIYSMTVLVVMLALATVAVDWGHKQLAVTELAGATDAAARAGASQIPVSSQAAVDAARLVGYANLVDNTNLEVKAEDVQIGYWNTSTKTFTATYSSPNACRVIGHRNATRKSEISTPFAGVFGSKSVDIRCESIAMQVPPVDVDHPTPGDANPFLAGMPKGSSASNNNPHNSPDSAGNAKNPKQSPLAVNLPISKGIVLNFDSITGIVNHDPNDTMYHPDGKLSDIGHNNPTPNSSNNYTSTFYNENGIADVRAPINALVGIFLTDKAPTEDGKSTPANLDFSTEDSRDFKTLEPKLKQIFFIGDGLDKNGVRQNFVVPEGATRLFLATWDFYEWNNNDGVRTIEVKRPQQIMLVKNELVK